MAAQRVARDVEVPPRTRGGGYWQKELEEWKSNPDVTFEYVGVNSSTSSNLRRDLGVDAETRTMDDDQVHLFVTYRPDKVDEIQAEYRQRRANRKAETQAQKVSAPNGGEKVKTSTKL